MNVNMAGTSGHTPLYCAAFAGHGRAVQVDPIKLTLRAPGTKRLKVKYEALLSNFAFKFNLRHYITRRWCARWWLQGPW